MTFKDFWQCYLFLNSIGEKLIMPILLQGEKIIIANQMDLIRTIIMYEFSSYGYLKFNKSEFLSLLFNDLKNDMSKYNIDEIMLNKFIELVMYEGSDSEIDIEHTIGLPYLVFQVNEQELIWDTLRQEAFLDAIRYKLLKITAQKDFGTIKGKAFEIFVISELQKIPGIESLHYNIDEKRLYEIDIGFIYKSILHLLELKSFDVKIGEFQGRYVKNTKAIKLLAEFDLKVANYKEKIIENWKGNDIKDIRTFLVTDNFYFIPFMSAVYWYDNFQIPRICNVNEFFNYLKKEKYQDGEFT